MVAKLPTYSPEVKYLSGLSISSCCLFCDMPQEHMHYITFIYKQIIFIPSLFVWLIYCLINVKHYSGLFTTIDKLVDWLILYPANIWWTRPRKTYGTLSKGGDHIGKYLDHFWSPPVSITQWWYNPHGNALQPDPWSMPKLVLFDPAMELLLLEGRLEWFSTDRWIPLDCSY